MERIALAWNRSLYPRKLVLGRRVCGIYKNGRIAVFRRVIRMRLVLARVKFGAMRTMDVRIAPSQLQYITAMISSPIVRPGSRTPGNPAQIHAEEESRPEKLNVPIIIAMRGKNLYQNEVAKFPVRGFGANGGIVPATELG